ncbi:MAG: imelysin family protein [Leptolyngbyaceae cyanobacterium MO_188.B28]|nr:imelysin family protein [Leptolyngbyaceae cyanobacterium MO_188.B28]
MSKRFCLAIASSLSVLAMGLSAAKVSPTPVSQLEQTPPLEIAALEGLDLSPYIDSYAELVYRNYRDSHQDALVMQQAIAEFLSQPNASTHLTAQEAWIAARQSYLQTEAFRFYEGPIDFVDPDTGEEGPEARINAWPMNEAFIDYVRGKANAGLINNPDFDVSIEEIIKNDQVTDEADVTTGWHAIEFLLWGQDFYPQGPGQRSFRDFAANQGNNNRRREYLTLVTDQLVNDLSFLKDEWKPNANNYRANFVSRDPEEVLSDIFTALATLSAFEMASERIAVPLDSSNQEDEHSCFSDTTHQDFVFNAKGIKNVYLGNYGDYYGQGFDELAAQLDPELNQKIILALNRTEVAVDNINRPFDQVLASPFGSPERGEVETVITAFEDQAELFQELGAVLGVNVEILAE